MIMSIRASQPHSICEFQWLIHNALDSHLKATWTEHHDIFHHWNRIVCAISRIMFAKRNLLINHFHFRRQKTTCDFLGNSFDREAQSNLGEIIPLITRRARWKNDATQTYCPEEEARRFVSSYLRGNNFRKKMPLPKPTSFVCQPTCAMCMQHAASTSRTRCGVWWAYSTRRQRTHSSSPRAREAPPPHFSTGGGWLFSTQHILCGDPDRVHSATSKAILSSHDGGDPTRGVTHFRVPRPPSRLWYLWEPA